MNTRDLQAFIAVVETGSIVAASARLHVTQPGVTRRIQNLEGMLGVNLLDRVSKPLKPTAVGHEVYSLGRKILRSVDDLRIRVAPAAIAHGEFRLGVPLFLSELVLADPIDRLREAFPRLSVRINAGWSPDMITQLQTSAIDAATLIMPDDVPLPRNVIVHRLHQYETLVVAARTAILPSGDCSLELLASHNWVLNQDGCGLRRAMKRAFDAAGLVFDVAVEAVSYDLQLSLVARGLGLGVVTPDMLARSPYRDAVRVLSVPGFRIGLSVWLAHLEDTGRLSAPISMLRQALVEQLQ